VRAVVRRVILAASLCLAACSLVGARADAAPTEVEGAAGGGLTPWAIEAPDSPQLSYWYVSTQDVLLQAAGVSGTVLKRLELSFGDQWLAYPNAGNALGLSEHLAQSVIGAKFALVESDAARSRPAIAIGVQVKNVSGPIVDTLRADNAISSTSGIDYYLAVTEVTKIAGTTVVADATLRATRANQFGLLGFGGGANGHNAYAFEPEFSLGAYLTPQVVFGGEYRFAPNNISAAVYGIREQSKFDIFTSYLPNKRFALTAAYLNLGQVGPVLPLNAANQQGFYLQVQSTY